MGQEKQTDNLSHINPIKTAILSHINPIKTVIFSHINTIKTNSHLEPHKSQKTNCHLEPHKSHKTVILSHINPIKTNCHIESHKSHKNPKINLLINFRDLPQPFHYLKLGHASFLLFYFTHPFIRSFAIPLHGDAGNMSHKYSPLSDHTNTTEATYS